MMNGWGNSWKTSWGTSWGKYFVERVRAFVKMPNKYLVFPRFKIGR